MSSLHALLIGVDHYDPNPYCDSLKGAVADVRAVEGYLRRVGIPQHRIRCLTSESSAAEEESAPENRPTYETMVRELQALTARAQVGEQVLIHFSGHGGRTATLIPGSKGEDGIDEGFVPPDVGQPEARYLRDVELAHLIDGMVAKGLLVTLIIDACHSGGMLRGHSALFPRGRRQVDPTPRPLESLVAPREELEETWRRLSERSYSTARGGKGSRWVPGSKDFGAKGFVLLAACRSVEAAYEAPVEGDSSLGAKPQGLLTHSLLGILAQEGGALSWQEVYDRLVPRVHRSAPFQTPVLEGEVLRSVLGADIKALVDGLNVLEVEDGALEDGALKDGSLGNTTQRLRLGGGQAMGLGKGAVVRIGESLFEVTEVGATSCRAEGEGIASILPGDRAVLVDPGHRLRRRVAWLPQVGRKSLRSLLDVESGSPSGRFLEEAQEGELADFQVIANTADEFEILHAHGLEVADVPRVPTQGEGAVSQVLSLLTQLARFYNVRDLENHDRSSPLRQAVSLELGLLPEGFELGQEVDPQPFEPGQIPQVELGRWVCLSITNRSLQALQIYVLDLQPGWGIEQVHPTSGVETLEGGQTLHKPLEIYLPEEIQGRREILKVLATAEVADLRWLCQPCLRGGGNLSRSTLGTPQNPLERLFSEVAKDGPKARHARTQYASRHWASDQAEFEVVAGPVGSG